jgi:hypothetical protein
MALQAPPELLGIHTNMPATIPDEIAKALASGGPPPAGLSADERRAWDQLDFFYNKGLGYALEMQIRPQTLYAIADSPVGLAAWMIDHDIASYKLISRVFDGQREGLTKDDILDNATLYWFSNTTVSSARPYWENKLAFFGRRTCRSPRPSASFRTRSVQPLGFGQSGRIPNSSITTSSTKAATLRPGNSHSSFQKRFAWASGHCANGGRQP